MPKRGIVTRPEVPPRARSLFPGVSMYPDDARLSVAEAAAHFGLTKANINKWYVDGHLKDVEKDEKGRRLYLMSELADAEQKTRHHPNSRRKPQLLAA